MQDQNINNSDRSPSEEAMLKLTALVRLKEALDGERFEECADLVVRAKEHGAEQPDIRLVIDQSLQGVGRSIVRPQKTAVKGRGLRRF